MKERMKLRVHRLNLFLNSSKAVIIVLVMLFAYFAYGNAQFNKQNQTLIANTNETVSQLKKVLCEDIPEDQCNLTQAVVSLKADNAQQHKDQTLLLCKLFIIGRNQLAAGDVTKVETICNEQIQELGTSPAGSSPNQTAAPNNTSGNTTTPTNQNQNSTPPSGGEQTPTPAQQPPRPVQVLGIPACVPLTNVCVRH